MIIFWFIIGVMVILAVSLLLLPLLRYPQKTQNTFFLMVFILLTLPLTSLFLYLQWGSSSRLKQTYALQQHAKQIQQEVSQLKNPTQVIQLLKARLRKTPNSARGWYLLGKIYFDLGHYQQAVSAFARANQIKPNTPGIMVLYAQTLFFANDRHLTRSAKKIVDQVLTIQPHNINAINLLALNAYRLGRYQKAVQYWKSLLPDFPSTSNDRKALLAMIEKAQKKLKYHSN